MARLFGTDGVRGVANQDLTAELAVALGAAAARRLIRTGATRRRVAVVGRDPRASGEMLEAAVIAGLTSEGVDTLRVGVLLGCRGPLTPSALSAAFGRPRRPNAHEALAVDARGCTAPQKIGAAKVHEGGNVGAVQQADGRGQRRARRGPPISPAP